MIPARDNFPPFIRFLAPLALACVTAGCTPSSSPAIPRGNSCIDAAGSKAALVHLWNGTDMAGWRLFLKDGTPESAVWSVDGDALRLSPIPNGYFRTETPDSNYLLHVEWRWPEAPGNSGVLLHIQQPDQVWPACIQVQLKAEVAGDLIGMLGVDFPEIVDKASLTARKLHPASEKPAGEWNICEILCVGDTIEVTVNGVIQNRATHLGVTSGCIGLQMEGRQPVEFRNVWLQKRKG